MRVDDPIAWFGGEFVPLSEVRISPQDRGFLFADGVYESVRAYPGSEAHRAGLFRIDLHMQRLQHSLDVVRIGGVDLQVVAGAMDELLDRNELRERDATVYLQITRGAAPRAHPFPSDQVVPTVYALASSFAPPVEDWREGIVGALVEDQRWGRCDVKSISLLPNVLAAQVARDRGAREAILVRDGVITEGAHTAAVFVRDGTLWTHPPGANVLPSITLRLVLELAERLSIPVRLQALHHHEIDRVQEMMVLGTTSEVMPVVRVDERTIGEGRPGPVTRRLQEAYSAMVR